MRALKVCPCIGCAAHERSCPNLVRGGRCTRCSRVADKARGSRQERGYDAEHYRLRQEGKPKVDAGLVDCARCAQPIEPGTPWALDHNDERTGYLGPSHAACNNSAGGRASHSA